jgi:hypothetical protein
MKRIAATLLGIVLAAGLAVAAAPDTPEEIALRALTAGDEASGWRDWHPDATHRITVISGDGLPDYEASYRLADWKALPDWEDDPQMAKLMQVYTETSRSAPELKIAKEGSGTIITAETRVGYTWGAIKGEMLQTDRFTLRTLAARPMILSLHTTYDYR